MDRKKHIKISDENKVISTLVKQLVKTSINEITYNTIADALNISISALRNKFCRNSFSLIDMVIICHMTGSRFSIETANEKIELTPELFLSTDELERLSHIKTRETERKINEFKKLIKTLDNDTIENLINTIKSENI